MTSLPSRRARWASPSSPRPANSNVPAAVFWMVGTLLSFSLMAISVRQLGGVLNLFELLMVRAVGGLVHPARRDGGAAFAVRLSRAAQAGHASHPQRHAFHRQPVLDQRRHRAAARDRVRDRIHDAGLGRPARGALPRRALHGQPRRHDRASASSACWSSCGPGIEAFQPAAIGVLVASFGYAVSNIATKKLIPVQSTIAILFWMNVMQIGHGADRHRSAVSAAARRSSNGSGRSGSRSAARRRTTA